MGRGSGHPAEGRPALSRRHAVAAARHMPEAVASTIATVRAASGAGSSIRVLLLGPDGRLRVAATHGPEERGGRLRSSRRRQVLQTGRSMHLTINSSAGRNLLMVPLTAGRRPIGLVEVVTAASDVTQSVQLLEAVASQAGATIVAAAERARSELELRSSEATLTLARELLRTRSTETALRAAADHIHEHLGAPVAGLLWNASGGAWEVVRIRGLGTRRRAEIRAAIGASDPGPSRHPPPGEVHRLEELLSSLTDLGPLRSRRAGAALLFVLAAPAGSRRFLTGVASLLTEAFEQVDAVDRARLFSRELDRGIAWTAHELRAPLVGARQAIDHVLLERGSPEARADMLRQTRRELSGLADLIDPLLRLPSDRRALPRRGLDLAVLVRETVDLCCWGEHAGRVRLRTEGGVMVRGHAAGLRTAVANLVRNSLAYSRPGTLVDVWVGCRRGAAVVVVTDRGPGVGERERERLPVRARSARGRDGHGLGLSIVQKIVEVHGGSLGLDSGTRGSRAWIRLPLVDEGRHRSAS